MASNKKWFKRALRTLSHGETHLWNLIKTKLVPEQVEYLESEFMSGNLNSPRTEDTLSSSNSVKTSNTEPPPANVTTPEKETVSKPKAHTNKKTTSAKKKASSKTTKKNVAKKIATPKEK